MVLAPSHPIPPCWSQPAASAPPLPGPCSTRNTQRVSGEQLNRAVGHAAPVDQPCFYCQVITHSEGKDTAASRAADQPSRRRLPPLAAAGASPLAAWPCALIAIIRRGAAAAWRPAVQPIALVRVAPRASMVGALEGLQAFRMATQYPHKTGCRAGWCNGRVCCPAAARWEAWASRAELPAVVVSTKWRPSTSLVSNAAQLPAGGIQACALCRCSLAALESASNFLGRKPAILW